MRKLALLLGVSLFSSLSSVFMYRAFFDRPQFVWNAEDGGDVRYAGLVDKLFNARSNEAFHASAPTQFTDAAEISTPAVVNIRALIENDGGLWGNSTLTGSSGSGVIMSPDGYIVTNHHVVERSSDIRVTLADKRKYKAKLVGSVPSTDIALLKITESELPFLVFGNSDSVRVGEWV